MVDTQATPGVRVRRVRRAFSVDADVWTVLDALCQGRYYVLAETLLMRGVVAVAEGMAPAAVANDPALFEAVQRLSKKVRS